MEINSELKQELLNELALIFPNQLDYKINNFQRLLGADTETFSFMLLTKNESLQLILRLYRGITDRAEVEFNTLLSLHTAGLSVPKPYFFKKKSKTVSRSYFVMEKIHGVLLSDYILENKSEEQMLGYFRLFIQEMVNIHTSDWRNLFPEIKPLDLGVDPYLYVDQTMRFPKEKIDQFNVVELEPLVEWLEKNKEKSEQLSLLHGDFHMNNVIITPERDLFVIDWADIRLGDFRHDLGFAIVATSSAGIDVDDTFIRLYETLSGIKVKNIEYFMILSILYNLLRCYSALTNQQITNENETTKNMLMITYRSYIQYLVRLVRKVTSIQLHTLEKALT